MQKRILLLFLLANIAVSFSQEKIQDTKKIKVPNLELVSTYKDIYKLPYSFKENRGSGDLLKKNTYTMMGASVVMMGLLYIMPESFTHWDRDDAKLNKLFKKWKEHVKEGPVTDEDDFVLNYVAHPYCGAIYYMAARSSGYDPFYSFIYSTILSTFFWEYGIEAFAEIPSKQDLIITPVVGSIFGEGFYLGKRYILQNDYELFNSRILGKTTLFLIDPITETTEFFLNKFGKSQEDSNISLVSFPTIARNGKLGYNIMFNMEF